MNDATQAPLVPKTKPTLTPEQEQWLLELVGSEKQVLEADHELRRELQVRDRCYTTWVENGKLSKLDATERYNRLKYAVQIIGKLLDMCPNASEVPF